MINYSKATLADIDTMQALIQPEVDSGIILKRTHDEMATNIRSYILAKDNQQIVGFLALHVHSVKLAEIRSLIVASNYQKKHIGSGLIEEALKEGRHLQLKEVLVLTYAHTFFTRLGFIEIPKESLPDHKIWADCINCKLFPVCNEISLIKTL